SMGPPWTSKHSRKGHPEGRRRLSGLPTASPAGSRPAPFLPLLVPDYRLDVVPVRVQDERSIPVLIARSGSAVVLSAGRHRRAQASDPGPANRQAADVAGARFSAALYTRSVSQVSANVHAASSAVSAAYCGQEQAFPQRDSNENPKMRKKRSISWKK